MQGICKDLKDEYDSLDALVASLDEQAMDAATPFFGWTIRDEITHVAFFDYAGRLAATDPEAFAKQTAELMEGLTEYDDLHRKVHAVGRAKTAPELLAWWRKERAELLEALAARTPKDRLPWYGPDMSARSFATARLMEAWAHGQDVADALKVTREPTDRLRHVAHIGFITFKWSFVNRGLEPPANPVRLELASPSGPTWEFGPADAKDVIRGTALDFCLAATQRRNVADTALIVTGDLARQWMEIAQTFAGPPETPPKPGERA